MSQTIGIIDRTVELGGHDRSELMLRVSQPLFTGFRLKSQVDLAENNKRSEGIQHDILANEIYHTIHLLFYQAKSLSNRDGILLASLQRLDIQLENVTNLYEAAQVMAFDTLQVYNQGLAIKIELENVRLQERLVNLKLAQLLDIEEPVHAAPVELSMPEAEGYTESRMLQTARQKRPELAGIRLALQGAEIQQKLARSGYFPNIFAQGTFHYAKPGLDPVSNEWMDYFSIGVSLQWNLWRWQGDAHKVEEFQVIENKLTLQQRELLHRIEFEVKESLENLQFSFEQVQLAQELEAQQAERYRIVSVQHSNGVASTNDLVTAETDLTRAALQTQQALVQYYIHLADLRHATGEIGERR